MNYIITGLVSLVVGILLYVTQDKLKENKELKRKIKENESARTAALENGVVCILRKHLMDEHETWMERGYITPQALENGLLMYKAYKGLGGNGMIDHMDEEIQTLPIHD